MDNDKLLELLRGFRQEQKRLKRYIVISWMTLLVIGIGFVAWLMQTVAHMREITLANTNAMTHMESLNGLDGKNGKDGLDGINGTAGQQGQAGLPGPAGPTTYIQPAAPLQTTVKAEIGPQGEPGEKGDKGEKGEPGTPARQPEFATDAQGKLLVRLEGDTLWQALPVL